MSCTAAGCSTLARAASTSTSPMRAPHLPLEPGLAHEVDTLLEDLDLLGFFDACATQLRADGEVATGVR